MSLNEPLKTLYETYNSLAHAVQTGIAFMMQHSTEFTSPKHLRTGLDMRAVDHGALVALLIEKKVITEEEYAAKLVEYAEREVKAYEADISLKLGAKVVLK